MTETKMKFKSCLHCTCIIKSIEVSYSFSLVFFFRFQLQEKFSPLCPVCLVHCVWMLEGCKLSWAASRLTNCSESCYLQTTCQPWDADEPQKALVNFMFIFMALFSLLAINVSSLQVWEMLLERLIVILNLQSECQILTCTCTYCCVVGGNSW